uniref:Synaptonemal complex central element protein 2 n=1 Tax=Oreochromis niloticus TaxID=8128 RepID=A0A669D6E1_ORENI
MFTGSFLAWVPVDEQLLQVNLNFNKATGFNLIYICCSSRTDDISRKAQESVEKINQSRISNQKMIDSFQEKLVEKVTDLCMQMKEHMYKVYEENSDKMQVNLQELQEVLESCTKFSHELLEANRALACLREGDMP